MEQLIPLNSKAFFYSFTLFMSFVVTHLDNTTNKRKQGYPEVITCLPEADIQFEGVKAWILQANTRQLVFFEFEADAKVPEHSHGYPQWGMVIDGKMELTINSKPRICEKGDEYVIPTGAKHCARFLSRTRVMDFFSEKTRYKSKTSKQSNKQREKSER
jgi:quercetin dioxygenase-like cupin family protein